MEKPKITPKDFFLWAGAMVAFYASVFAFVSLIFAYLNYLYPDAVSYYSGNPYTEGISYYMATLIVLSPLFVVLTRFIHMGIEVDETRRDVWVRRWALYLTLFVAGITVAGDLITLIMYFFNGDVTLRFALKVLVILLVAIFCFMYFLADLKNYWQDNPILARLTGYAVGALVIVSIVSGFFVVGTPWQAREYRYDEQRVLHLQDIQAQLIEYWRQKEVLPAALDDLKDSISGYYVPEDPLTNMPYEYRAKGDRSFEICATFNAVSRVSTAQTRAYPAGADMYIKPELAGPWTHTAGRACFERTIDPDRYPPYIKGILE